MMSLELEEDIRTVTDKAFDVVDEDGSGGLDAEELTAIIDGVAVQMGVNPPK
jgi:Ca2+-binding EF-hand superfamily protein